MLKVASYIPKHVKRYCLKNTINAKLDRSVDLLTASAAGLCIQSARFNNWGMSDIGITSTLITAALYGLKNAIKNRIDLVPIKKRAKDIKKASKV